MEKSLALSVFVICDSVPQLYATQKSGSTTEYLIANQPFAYFAVP